MRRFLLALVAAVLGCSQATPTSMPSIVDRRAVIDSIEASTVAFVRSDNPEPEPYCAGVWVGQEQVLTALHCMIEEDPILVLVTQRGPIVLGQIIAGDARTDLVLLETTPVPSHPIANVARRMPRPGDGIHVVGHTVGYPWTYTSGTVAAIRLGATGPQGSSLTALQVSALVWFGNSGGGAWNEAGELVGISSWVSTRGPGLSFFVAAPELRKFLSTFM